MVSAVVTVFAAIGLLGSPATRAQDFSIETGSRLIRAPVGSTVPLVTSAVPGAFVGWTCTVVSVEVLNQPSVHQGNDLTVMSGGSSVMIFGVEDTPGQVREATGRLTLGASVEIDLTIGNTDASDNMPENYPPPPEIGTFSAGLRIDFDNCTPPDTTTTEATTTTSTPTTSSSSPTTTSTTTSTPTSTTPPPEGEIEFDLLDPVCVDDFPFIDYAVSGDVAGDARATIEIADVNGVVVQTLVDQPLSGRLIWPGASVDPPDWPGWVLDDDGVWVEDPTDAVLREDLTVTVSVNPSVSDTVAYPPATPTCEAEPIAAPALIPVVQEAPNVRPPGQVPTTTPTTTPTALPVTGPGHTSTLALIAAAVTVCGCVLYSVRRRPAE
jgi:hypothetical protein